MFQGCNKRQHKLAAWCAQVEVRNAGVESRMRDCLHESFRGGGSQEQVSECEWESIETRGGGLIEGSRGARM